jgi:rubrerythrin
LEEINKLKQYRQIQARFEKPLTDEQLEKIAEQDRLNKQRAEQRERDRIEAAARDAEKVNEIRRKAVEFVNNGRIIVSLQGVRVPTITEGLAVPCPECGAPIQQSIQDPLFIFARDWIACEDPAIRYSGNSPVLRTSQGHFMTSPAYLDTLKCPSCKKTALCVAQLVIC